MLASLLDLKPNSIYFYSAREKFITGANNITLYVTVAAILVGH